MAARRTVIRRTGVQRDSDTQALNIIATILGASEEWSSEMLEWIADEVARTGRPHPGDQPEDVLAMYRRAADRLSIQHDGDE